MSESQNDSLNEQTALELIARLIKNYEEKFELKSSFTSGAFGFSDPKYPAVRLEWFQNLERSGRIQKKNPALESLLEDILADTERGWQESQPADSRINWRVTVQHDDYYIHVMAVDKNFERFAFSLQTERAFKAGLYSDKPRPDCSRYEVVNRMSDLKPIFDEVYGIFKRSAENRQHQEDIDRAVAAERAKWEKRIAEKEGMIIHYIMIAVFIVLLIIITNYAPRVSKYFSTQIEIIGTVLGAGIISVLCTCLYFVTIAHFGLKIGLLKDRKPAPWLWRSVAVVFIMLWAILAFLGFKGLI
ncbi:hypothetical protein [Rhodoblastus sp.]|uniref:hypothetical protein n=1 Tax=Rhodoblastus sp. TaxID=1962975 RepID=UPI003F9BB099